MSKAKIDMMEQEQDKNEKTKNSELKERPVRRKKRSAIKRIVLFLIAAIFAISFLLPTVLTFANSFMSEQEISSNYGVIFNDYTSEPDGKDRTVTYRTKTVNLKLIPDKVVGTQYETVLLKSPDYLMTAYSSDYDISDTYCTWSGIFICQIQRANKRTYLLPVSGADAYAVSGYTSSQLFSQ